MDGDDDFGDFWADDPPTQQWTNFALAADARKGEGETPVSEDPVADELADVADDGTARQPDDEADHLSDDPGEPVRPSSPDLSIDPDRRPDDEDDAAEDARWGLTDDGPQTGIGAPPVVAVLIAKDPGDWFEHTLDSLADQDYQNLSVLVIDNGGEYDPTPLVAECLPSAFVKRLPEDRGFSAAANEALDAVKGAPFYLFLHDDVRLAPDLVTSLVAEAFRANAGIVGPKIVDWDDPGVLRSVGLAVDPYGTPSPLVDPGELDQSQHDIARNVFAVSDATMLVRADLFATLQGFNPEIPFFGEDVDLCWRAHIAGAAVQFSPRAVVGHREGFDQRRPMEVPRAPGAAPPDPQPADQLPVRSRPAR